jgi:hypothetical protein
MIAVSLKDGEGLVDLFLGKGADVNAKSEWAASPYCLHVQSVHISLQISVVK